MFEFHHVALSVSDLQKSKNFYAILGFQVALEWVSDNQDLTIMHLKLGAVILELFCYRDFSVSGEKSLEDDLHTVGIKHFGLQVDSIEDAKRKVVSAGLAEEEDIQVKKGRTGITYFFLRDPDKNFVEIVENKRKFDFS